MRQGPRQWAWSTDHRCPFCSSVPHRLTRDLTATIRTVTTPSHLGDVVDPDGIDTRSVGNWLEDTIPGATGPFAYDLITGGHSNLTFAVTDAAQHRYVLRRPPLSHGLSSAHDMAREARIIDALGPTDVPVPPVLGLCSDESINGAPFYVMDFVDGHVIRDVSDDERRLS